MNNKFFRIEKCIPIQEKTGPNSKYPFNKMEVGDSFLVDRTECTALQQAAYMHGVKHNKKFSTRKISEEYQRVWRIK